MHLFPKAVTCHMLIYGNSCMWLEVIWQTQFGVKSAFFCGEKKKIQNITVISFIKNYSTRCNRHGLLVMLRISKKDGCECQFVQGDNNLGCFHNKEIQAEVAAVMGTHPLHWHLLKCWKIMIYRLNIKLYKIYWHLWYSKRIIYL